MKKSTIKLIAMLLTVVLMLPNFAGAGALNENEMDDGLLTQAEAASLLNRQAAAMDAYEEIKAMFVKEHGSCYPEAFGGFYIEDGERLVVKLVNNDGTLRRKILDTVSNPTVVSFENTNISFIGLFELQRNLHNIMPDVEINSSSIDVRNSTVNVSISKQELSQNRRGISYSHPNLSISVASYTMDAHSLTYNPGSTISAGQPAIGTGSLGWYGTYYFGNGAGSKPCFVTAGHVIFDFNYATKSTYFSGTNVFDAALYTNKAWCHVACGSSPISKKGSQSGTSDGDYAFLRYDPSVVSPSASVTTGLTTTELTNYSGREYYNPTTGEYSIDPSAGYNCDIPAGTYVVKSAGVSGYKSGRVKECNYCDGDKYTGANNASYYYINCTIVIEGVNGEFSIPGDSGATVFYGTTNGNTLLGIVTGSMTQDHGEYANQTLYNVTPLTIMLYNGFIPYPWCDIYN